MRAFVGAAVIGFVVLQAKVSHVIAQGVQEVIIAIVGCCQTAGIACFATFSIVLPNLRRR